MHNVTLIKGDGSAPDIEGKNLANPMAVIMASVMLLHHLGEKDAANRIQTALEQVIDAGEFVTPVLINAL